MRQSPLPRIPDSDRQIAQLVPCPYVDMSIAGSIRDVFQSS